MIEVNGNHPWKARMRDAPKNNQLCYNVFCQEAISLTDPLRAVTH